MPEPRTNAVGKRVPAALYEIICIAVAALFLLPFVWVFSASLRPSGLPPPRTIEWLPNTPAWSNYSRVFEMLPFGNYLLNSLIIVAFAIPLTLITASWAGFAAAQLEARKRNRVVVFSLTLLLIPFTSLWLTRYILFQWLGLINTWGALLAPALMGSSPLFVLLFYWTFRRVPPALWEAARLDGASLLAVWWRIGLPLAKPTITAVTVQTFLLYWSDFINPLLYLKSQHLYTLPVGIQQLQQLDKTNWSLLMAAAVVLLVPALFAFLAAQRYFLGDNRLGGISGE